LRAPPRMACSAVKSGGRQRYSWNCFPSTAVTCSSAAAMSNLLPRQASCSQKLLVNCAAYMITDTVANSAAADVDSGRDVSQPLVTADTTADSDIDESLPLVTADTTADSDIDESRPLVTADTTADSDIDKSQPLVTADTTADSDIDESLPLVTADTTADSDNDVSRSLVTTADSDNDDDSDIAQALVTEYVSEMSSACEDNDSNTSRTDVRLSFSDDECFIEVPSNNNNNS